jgi:nitrogen fixation protein FixH
MNHSPKKTKNILWFFVIFFSTFIIVDICYIFIAEKTWRGLATEDGYQKGLKYNQTIEVAKEQKQLGWNLKINYQPQGKKIGNLVVRLSDKNNEVILGANIIAYIKRPVQEGVDFSQSLQLDPKTMTYQSLIEFPLIGQWDIDIVANKENKSYQDKKRFVIGKNF